MAFDRSSLLRATGFLASPRFTVFNFSLLLLNALLMKPLRIETTGFFSLATGLLFINLLFCMVKRRFASYAVTLFHIALLFFILFLGLSSLFYFYGYIELAEGQRDGVQRFVKGVFHEYRLKGAVFVQGKIDIRYAGTEVAGFSSALSVETPDGENNAVPIEFLSSFEWGGYDFYVHRDRGYAVELEFKNEVGKKRGFVDLPHYVSNPGEQTKYFDIPGEELGFVASLNISDRPGVTGEWFFEIPSEAVLTLERGSKEFSLRRGESVVLDEGETIRFLNIVRWVNYVVYKNSFGVGMALSGGAAFLALLFHLLTGVQVGLWKRFS